MQFMQVCIKQVFIFRCEWNLLSVLSIIADFLPIMYCESAEVSRPLFTHRPLIVRVYNVVFVLYFGPPPSFHE